MLIDVLSTIKSGIDNRKPKKKKKIPVRDLSSDKGGELGSGAAQNVINKKKKHKKKLESHLRKEMKGRR